MSLTFISIFVYTWRDQVFWWEISVLLITSRSLRTHRDRNCQKESRNKKLEGVKIKSKMMGQKQEANKMTSFGPHFPVFRLCYRWGLSSESRFAQIQYDLRCLQIQWPKFNMLSSFAADTLATLRSHIQLFSLKSMKSFQLHFLKMKKESHFTNVTGTHQKHEGDHKEMLTDPFWEYLKKRPATTGIFSFFPFW